MYALNLDPETNRILSITEDEFGIEGQPRVESFPEDDVSNYLYINNEFVYDPLSVEPEEPYIEPEERIAALEQQNEMLLECNLEMSELLYE